MTQGLFWSSSKEPLKRESWPKTQWAALVSPLLTGESKKAYYDFEATDAQDYEKVKQEILVWLDVNLALWAQQVSSWSF